MPGPYVGNPFAGYGGLFQRAVNDPTLRAIPGGIVQYVWASIREDYPTGGKPLPSGAFQHVNQLLSWAGQTRRAQLNLAQSVEFVGRTGIDQAVVSDHIAPHLDTRALNEMPLGPQHRVVYQTQDLVEGEPVLSYKTHDFGYNLPQSISQLNRDVEDAAQITAADYGYEWGGVATPVGIYSY